MNKRNIVQITLNFLLLMPFFDTPSEIMLINLVNDHINKKYTGVVNSLGMITSIELVLLDKNWLQNKRDSNFYH